MTADQKKKQSFLAGALTSSAGVFIAKALGLLYVVPFTAIASEENMAFYSAAYTYYDILLQICSAGLPFAIAAIIAKYANRDDYKTVLLVRKLSTSILAVSGFIMAVIFAMASTPLAKIVLGTSATASDISIMRTCFIILALALFLVPILYSYRCFYQGLKEMKAYAFSQVIEQIVRIASLLLLGWFVVYILGMNRINAVYMAVLATSLGALSAIIFYINFDHHHYGAIARAARLQKTEGEDPKIVVQQLFAFGLPYLLSSILGNTQTLINTNFFISVNTGLGMDYQTAKLLYGIIQVQCDKLTSIPQVLAIGFSAGIVPYMTVALENHDIRGLQKNILTCLDTVFYISIPICFCLLTLAEPIYYIMYGGANLAYGGECLRWSSLLALCTTVTPICTSMMMTLRQGNKSILYLLMGLAVKCITFYPLIKYTGYTGAITSSILTSMTIIFLDLSKLHNRFEVNYTRTARRVFRILLGCFAMNGAFALLKMTGMTVTNVGRVTGLLELAVYGIVGMLVYYLVTSFLNVPQNIFGMNTRQLLDRIFRRNRKQA